MENYFYEVLYGEGYPYIPFSPDALYCSHSTLGENLRVLFIEYVKGETLTAEIFRTKADEEQEQIKAAILEAYTCLRTQHRINHNDPRWENHVWDKDTGMLTILDLEAMMEQAGEPLSFYFELRQLLRLI